MLYLLVAGLSVATLSGEPPAPAEPPPLLDPLELEENDGDGEDLEGSDPAEAAPPTPQEGQEPEALPAPPPRPPSDALPPPEAGAGAPAPLEPVDGLSPFVVLPLQVVAGFLVSTLTSPLCFLSPFVVATVGVTLADAIGTKRGALQPAILGGYAGMALGAAVPLVACGGLAVAALVLPFVPGPGPIQRDPFVGGLMGAGGAFLLLSYGASFALPAAHFGNALGVAIAYQATAEDKLPGDTEFRFPGFEEPAHGAPAVETRAPEGESVEPSTVAMLY